MRILLFGGSFDPPHAGHRALLLAAARALRPDAVSIVPAWQAPLKNGACAPASDRLAMVGAGLLGGLPPDLRRITRVDRSELDSRRRVYTVETLRRIRRRSPRAELHFAVGADSAASFGRWREPRALRSLCAWWTARRPGTRGKAPRFFHALAGRMPDVSSTGLRARLAAGVDVRGLLPTAVLSHIRRRGLYGSAVRRTLEASLPPERYRHTLAVARLALELAERHGLDPEKAAWAALLHDCGRTVLVDAMPGYVLRRRLDVPGRRDVIRRAPLLLHAYISADLARRRFGIADRAVLDAVRHHTLGRPGMPPLCRLLYVADSCSADRSFPEAARIRRRARRSLDEAFRLAVAVKRRYAAASGGWVHPATERLHRWAQRILR